MTVLKCTFEYLCCIWYCIIHIDKKLYKMNEWIFGLDISCFNLWLKKYQIKSKGQLNSLDGSEVRRSQVNEQTITSTKRIHTGNGPLRSRLVAQDVHGRDQEEHTAQHLNKRGGKQRVL